MRRSLHKNFITRLEFRYDNANNPLFAKASTFTDYQRTIELGLIYTV